MRTMHRLLWGVNFLIIGGLVLSALAPPESVVRPEAPRSLPPEEARAFRRDLNDLRSFSFERPAIRVGEDLEAKLLGTDSIANRPELALAYLQLPGNVSVVIAPGEAIGEWKLQSITPTSALFSKGTSERTLRIE